MIVHDVHTHIFPDKIAKKATKSIGDFYEFDKMFCPATPENLIKHDDKISAGFKVVCSSAVTKEQVDGINSYIIEECRKNPLFVGFAALHPETENFEEVLDFAEENGLRGVKFHSDFQKFDIDDKITYPIYKSIAKRKMPVLFHMGDYRYDYSSPLRLKKLMYDIPDLIVIAAHFGGYRRWDDAFTLEKSENLYFDTSSSLYFINDDTPYKFIDKFGEDCFMFGTDFPMWNPTEELNRFLSLNLGDEKNEKILHKNFEKLFSLEYKGENIWVY